MKLINLYQNKFAIYCPNKKIINNQLCNFLNLYVNMYYKN